MSKRDGNTIVLGSGKVFIKAFSETMPTTDDLCKDENLLGKVKGGGTVTYTQNTYVEKDDLGTVQKIITTDESVTLGLGLITWNGNTLQKLIDNCTVTEEGNKRIIKIGGTGNTQGEGYYAVAFKHEDKNDGNLVALIKGKNTAGATLTFAKDSGSKLEPTFTAVPQDDEGTLLYLEEEISEAG